MSAKGLGGLGRGIDALISDNFDKSLLSDNKRTQFLFISDITPLEDQPRKHFEDSNLRELAESIKEYGVIQPLIVTPKKDGKYSLIAGERRWRASQIAGLNEVPVVIRDSKEQEKLEIALIENVQRVDLSPLETAVAIEKLHQDFNLTYSDVAHRLSKATTTVNNIVRLLQLPEDAKKALQEGKISEGHARTILSLKGDYDKQKQLLRNIIVNGWSVRQAEQFVVSSKQGAKTSKQIAKKMSATTPESEQLSKKLNTNVNIKRTARGGRIEIIFKNDEQLEKLLKNLSS